MNPAAATHWISTLQDRFELQRRVINLSKPPQDLILSLWWKISEAAECELSALTVGSVHSGIMLGKIDEMDYWCAVVLFSVRLLKVFAFALSNFDGLLSSTWFSSTIHLSFMFKRICWCDQYHFKHRGWKSIEIVAYPGSPSHVSWFQQNPILVHPYLSSSHTSLSSLQCFGLSSHNLPLVETHGFKMPMPQYSSFIGVLQT